MSKINGQDDVMIMSENDVCTIHLPECEQLMEESRRTENRQLRIEFADLCYTVYCKGTSKTILSNVTGHFEPGKITAILGPSGAGKSTLLKIISGERLQNLKGTVTINGVQRKKAVFRKEICYVPQQFALLSFLTAKETLYIAARLKLDAKESEESTNRIVKEIAKNLGLLNCLDTIAEKLSGGERKRLSLGVEMVTKPSILLLDEPTSGLDSAASNQLINVLHEMAQANCTVVCAVHQPSSQMITHLDDITVLANGKSMYCGPRDKMLDIFDQAGYTCPQFYNIAEFVLEVITEQRVGNLENLHRINREEYEKIESQQKRLENGTSLSKIENCLENDNTSAFIDNAKRLSTWQQQKVLFQRALIGIKRDTTMTKLRFGTHIAIAFLLGIVFYDFGNDASKVISTVGCLFVWQLFLFFANSMPAVQIFPNEVAVFLQEHLNNWYSLRSYYIVKILTDFPMQVLCSSSFFIISYYMTGHPIEYDRIFYAWSICLLVTILGQTVGIVTGVVFNVEIGIFLVAALSTPLMLFGGFFVKFEEIPFYLQPLCYISHFRYSFEGIMQAIYFDRPSLSCFEVYCPSRSPRVILSTMDMPTMPFYAIIIILGFWIFCLHVITYAVFCWKIYYAKK